MEIGSSIRNSGVKESVLKEEKLNELGYKDKRPNIWKTVKKICSIFQNEKHDSSIERWGLENGEEKKGKRNYRG